MKKLFTVKKKRRRTPRGRAASAPATRNLLKDSPSSQADAGQAESAFSRQEEDQFAALVAENLSWAKGFARGFWVTDPELAVFEALRKTLLRFDPAAGSFRSFLRRILFCELISMIRRDERQRRLFVHLAEDFEPVDEAAAIRLHRCLVRDWLRAGVQQLSAEDQELIRLKYDQDLTIAEICACL